MHEAAITEALVEQVREFLPASATLTGVRIEVGELEHLDPVVMRTVWEVATAGTELEGAALTIERVPLSVRCRRCGTEHAPEDPAILLCPDCGAVAPEVLRGSGVVLRSLEVEER
jgi:hydrogenase nickel incorporation protein HypA/HybF